MKLQNLLHEGETQEEFCKNLNQSIIVLLKRVFLVPAVELSQDETTAIYQLLDIQSRICQNQTPPA